MAHHLTSKPASEPNLHELLRQGTASAHQAIGEVPMFKRLFDSDYMEAEYGALLASLLTYHQRLEPLLRRWLGADFARFLDRVDRLEMDLRSFPSAGMSTPRTAAIGWLTHRDGALGALYVLEGSELGGRMIARALAMRFPGKRWAFHRDDFDAGQRWRHFLSFLPTYQEPEPVIQGANSGFASLMQHLTRGQPTAAPDRATQQ